MKLWYSIIEFNTALKPYCFAFLFKRLGFDSACYIDPDIFVYSPLAEAFELLEGNLHAY